jgi:hypothetical protein
MLFRVNSLPEGGSYHAPKHVAQIIIYMDTNMCNYLEINIFFSSACSYWGHRHFITQGLKWRHNGYVLSTNQHVGHSEIGLELWKCWLSFWKFQVRNLAASRTGWYFCCFSRFLHANTAVVPQLIHAISESLFLSHSVIRLPTPKFRFIRRDRKIAKSDY